MTDIRDATERSRFELDSSGAVAFVTYRLDGGTLALLHTEVPDALAGQGIGSRLARGVLDLARARGLRVVPECSFIASWIDRHPAYADLLADRA